LALILPFRGKRPRIAPDAFVAPTAVVIGDVVVESEASVWFGAVLRGDNPEQGIVVGPRASIQDNCVIHVGDWCPTLIGADVTVGHGAKFESCRIGDGTMIGMNAVILPRVTIGQECLIAANCVVLEGEEIPDHSVVVGVPGQVSKELRGKALEWIRKGRGHYAHLAREYLDAGIGRVPEEWTP
jgi:carbonic anhydrase/acetyltransferase-like protein (isoleucine patch superfamily)